MSDHRLDDQLHSYAAHVQSVDRLPTPAAIRELAHRRRQRQVAITAFSVVLVGTLGLGLGLGIGQSTSTPNPPASAAPATATPSPTGISSTKPSSPPADGTPDRSTNTTRPGTTKVASNVSQLKSLGVDLNVGVLIDVADDGQDRYLAIGEGGVVDFTGTSKTDNTMMALKPAKVAKNGTNTKNRVVIAPPFYNEDLGTGSCVADTAAGVLRLAPCDADAANQTWQVIPAGDSGQFELHGANTEIRVDNGKITTNQQGYVGLQTIKFAP